MDLFGIKRAKQFREQRLARLRAGRFFYVTCERGHKTQMSGIDLCRRLEADPNGEKVLCPECYEVVKVVTIVDGPLMSEDEKKKQQEEYLQWETARQEQIRKELMAPDDAGLV